MIIVNFVLSIIFLLILIKSADYSIKYSSRIAKHLHFSEFIVSFFIIAIISVLPEATISIISALNGESELGFGTLLGSNIVDLTLVFGIIAIFSSGGIKVKSKILRNNFFYLGLLLFPLILGLDGNFSRIDGAILVLVGGLFFVKLYFQSIKFKKKFNHTSKGHFTKNFLFLIISLIFLLVSAYFIVKFSTKLAYEIKIPPLLIGITILALGTCLPEFIFSIKAVKNNRDELALGDILGTVITDATVVLGVVALISPFEYNLSSIYVTGGAMFLAGVFATIFMKSDKSINKIEGLLLILFYILFVFLQFFINGRF